MTTTEERHARNAEQAERQRVNRAVMDAVGHDRAHYLQLAHEVADRSPAAHDYPTLDELRAMLDAAPAYLARVAAEQQDQGRNPAATAAAELAALEDAIHDGVDIDPATYAAARSKADAEQAAAELADKGRKVREKAARELAKSQAAALDAVRKNPPQLAELDDALEAALAALDAAQAAISDYRAQIDTAAQTMRDGGIVATRGLGDIPPGFSNSNHVGHGYVKVDGVTYAPADHVQRIRRRIAEHPLMTGRAAA